MKKDSRLVTVFWVSLLVLTIFPFAVKPALAETSFNFEFEVGGLVDPEFVAADYDGNFFVADDGNNRVQGFNGTGNFLWSQVFYSVGGIAARKFGSGIVYVTNPAIQAMCSLSSATGVVLTNVTTPSRFGAIGACVGDAIYVEDLDNPGVIQKYFYGNMSLQWASEAYSSVVGIAVDDNFYDRVYVAESDQVHVLSATTGEELYSSWIPGFPIGGIAVDGQQNIYLTDGTASTVSKFTYYGTLFASMGGYGSGPGQFIYPTGVAVGGSASVYVADTGNDRIQKFSQIFVPDPAPEGSYTYGGPSYEYGTSVVETSDGGFALAGSTSSFGAGGSDFWLVRTDSDGVMLWNQTYGSSDSETATSVVETVDGGFAIVGTQGGGFFGPPPSKVLLVRTDSNGVELWNRTYGESDRFQNGYSVVECGVGGFAIAARTTPSYLGDTDAWLIRTDSSGFEIWNQTYSGAGADYLNSVVETVDGGFALAGYTDSYGSSDFDLWLVKTNSAGVMLWNRTYGGPSADYGSSLVECDDAGFALAGANNTFFGGVLSDAWLFRTDSSGNELWNQTYGGPLNDRASSITKTVDGGFAFAGGTESFGVGHFDAWFVEVDSNGVMLRSQTYGGLRSDSANSLVQTVDGGFALAGSTQSFGAGETDFYLVKTEAEAYKPVHNLDTGLDYYTIQDAIDASETLADHTILVDSGTYVESVQITKSISLIGEARNNTIIDGNGALRVIAIYSDGISVDGFTVMNSSGTLGEGGGGLVVGGVGNIQVNNIIALNNDADWGVHLNPNSYNVSITNTIIVNNTRGGLLLNDDQNVTVSNNLITNNNWSGISLENNSSYNTISGNTITNNNASGIFLYQSSNNIFFGNTLTNNNGNDIHLYGSYNNTVYGNNMTNNNASGIFLHNSSYNTISVNNVTNSSHTGIGLHISSNNTVSGNTITNNSLGIGLEFSDNNIVSGNTITSNTWTGIRLQNSSNNNLVSGNTVTNNNWRGIYLSGSSYNTVSGNNVTNNGGGIYLESSSNNTVSGNNVTDNDWHGINLGESSPNNLLSGNNVANNYYGIHIGRSPNNTLTDNNITGSNSNFGVWGDQHEYFLQDIDTSNTVDGKIIYYLLNQSDLTIDPVTFPNIGFLGLVDSTNITVRNLTLTNNMEGILCDFLTNSTIENVNMKDNISGLYISGNCSGTSATNNIMTGGTWGIIVEDLTSGFTLHNNTIANSEYAVTVFGPNNTFTENSIINNENGVLIQNCSGNIFYHNDIISNTVQANVTSGYTNTWDNDYPSGGNYWSDYIGVDLYSGASQDILGSDGIGDTPYIIGGTNQDNYPLMDTFQELGFIYFESWTYTETFPSSDWNYTLIEDATETIATSFTLPSDDNASTWISDLNPGWYTVNVTSKFGYGTTINANGLIVDGFQAPVYVYSGYASNVSVTNYFVPAFAQSLDEVPPADLDLDLPAATIVPVQAVWNVDVDGNGIDDLVSGKATAILVNLTAVQAANPGPITVRVTFEGETLVSVLGANGVAYFYPVYPSTAASLLITGEYVLVTGAVPLISVEVSVKETNNLSLYYSYLSRRDKKGNLINYGEISAADYDNTVKNSNDFINATYPVANVDADLGYNRIAGAKAGKKDPFAGILTDCLAAALQAQVNMGGSAVGIAVVPEGYFGYHLGYSGVAGISFGPAVKGVVVADKHYTAAAHEYAHTLGLNYFPEAEQYLTDPEYGKTASGVWASDGLWTSGYGFMGLAPYDTLDYTWVHDSSTYFRLFEKLRVNQVDPEILLFNVILYDNGTVAFPLPLMQLEEGTADVLEEGEYSLVFLDEYGNPIPDSQVNFAASFYVNVDPGISVGDNAIDPSLYGTVYGELQVGVAGASFATVLPDGTAQIQLVNNTIPEEPEIMATIEAEEIVNADFSSDAYFTNVDHNPIDAFECVFTPDKKAGGYKMTATNPGTFCYNLEITNNFEAAMFFAEVEVPEDFVLKYLGDGPVRVDGESVAYSLADGVLSVENIYIEQGQTVTLSVYLDYGLKFQYGADQPYDESSQDTYFAGYAFRAQVNSLQADSGMIAAVGKKVTAIGGFLTDVWGFPKGGLTVNVTVNGDVVGSVVSSGDGFYFVEVPAGTYDVRAYNSLEQPVGSMVPNVVVKKDRYVAVDFDNLNPADPVIEGFVKDAGDDGVGGVKVQLLNHKGKLLASTTTNMGGYYIFRFTQPGNYVVAVVAPEGYVDPESVSLKVKQFEAVNVSFNLERVEL